MRNFWQATPREVCLSAGLGDGPLPADDGDGVAWGREKGLNPLGVPPGWGGANAKRLARSFSSVALTSWNRSASLRFRASSRRPTRVARRKVVPCHW